MDNLVSFKNFLTLSLIVAVCITKIAGLSIVGLSHRYETCLLKGKCQNSRVSDIEKDESLLKDSRDWGKIGFIRISVRKRCGNRLCKSKARVFIYSRFSKKYCHRSSLSSSYYVCPTYWQSATIVVYWPGHRKKVVISNLNAGVSIRVVLPRSHLVNQGCTRLSSCAPTSNPPQFPVNVIITDAIQGIRCPSGRRRFPVGSKQELSTRTLDGRLNNAKKIFNGASGENLLRLSRAAYVDGKSVPAGTCTAKQRAANRCPFPKENEGKGSNRPNPRVISNALIRQEQDIPSSRGLSSLSVYFGQLLDHDSDLTEELPRTEEGAEIPIQVPKGDVIFDPESTGKQKIPLRRFEFDTCTGNKKCRCPREQINTLSAVIDANTVYGSDKNRSRALRTLKDGLMKLDKHGNLPFNTFGLPNANAIGRVPTRLRIGGDVRVNVAPTLLTLHTLFVREHNRLARLYKRRHPRASDEQIFQYARKILIAEMQAIIYREYIPALLGRSLPKYRGYNPKINVGITNEFANAAFRFGHSQISTLVFRLDKRDNVSPFGHLLLREGFLRPERITEEGGIDAVLRGATFQPSQELDSKIVDELRNFLFPTNGHTLDLAAINIQRGREVGIPDYNTVRASIGLPRKTSFGQITRNRKVASILKSLYKSVDNIDLWVGGISEDHVRGSELGETLEKIFIDQMTRRRDGDRFWYEKILSRKEIDYVHKHTLGRIIRLNTGFKNAPENAFFSRELCRKVKNNQCVKRKPTCKRVSFFK